MLRAEMKFRVRDSVHSAEIQQALFKAGYMWGNHGCSLSFLDCSNFLYTYSNGYITYSRNDDNGKFFNEHRNEEYLYIEGKGFIKKAYYIEPKPPINLRPRYVVEAERLTEVLEAMHHYATEGRKIPAEWIEELYDLNGRVKN